MISMIVAMADNRAIGKDNQLLWHLPDDFKHFKAVTMAKPILMGRKTYQSIGKPLPGRQNIVISKDQTFAANGVAVVNSIEAALDEVETDGEVMVIGGASFYQQMLPLAEKLYVTHVHQSFDADTFFPEIDAEQWRVVDRVEHAADEKHAYRFTFITYQKV